MTATAESTDAFSVQHIAPEDISTAASLIYQAYQNDPILQTLLGYNEDNPLDYEKKLRALIREELSSFWQEKQQNVGMTLHFRWLFHGLMSQNIGKVRFLALKSRLPT